MGEGGAGGEVRAPELTIVNQKKEQRKNAKIFFINCCMTNGNKIHHLSPPTA